MLKPRKHRFFPLKGYFFIHPALPFTFIVLVVYLHLLWLSWIIPQPSVLGSQTDLTPSQLIALTNLERSRHQLPPLKANHLLSQAAQAKARHMLTTGNFKHYYETPSDSIDPWQFITAAGYDYAVAGENLGRGFTDSTSLINAWMNSPPHRANLLNPEYVDIGIALAQGNFADSDPTTIVVQFFASPLPEGYLRETDTQAPPPVNSPPLVSTSSSFFSHFSSNYPLTLGIVTLASLLLAGFLILLDRLLHRLNSSRQSAPALSNDLWRH